MFRIGLSGVPGSGKSETALLLKSAIERLDLDSDQGLTPVAIIDEYVEPLEAYTGLALDFNATYVGNLHVALERDRQERMARDLGDYKTIITCGTLYETATYSAMWLERESQLAEGDRAEQYDLTLRVEGVLRMMACLYVDITHYDHIFYLAPTHVTLDPEIGKMERNLQAAFNAFALFPVTYLPAVDRETFINDQLTIFKENNGSDSSGENSETQVAD